MRDLLLERDYDTFKRAWMVAMQGDIKAGPVQAVYSVLAEAALSIGDHERLRELASRLLHEHNSPIGHYYLCLSRFLFGDYQGAAEEAMCMLHRRPGHADVTYLLAQSLGALGDKAEAWAALEALALRSRRGKTWLVMANLVDSGREFLRLHNAWHAWHQRDSKRALDMQVSEYLALGALRSRNYAVARSIWRGTLFRALDQGFASLAPKRISYSSRKAEQALLDLKRTFEAADIEMFLVSGTLLGCVREGRLLPHDKDVDVGVWSDVNRQWLLQAVRDSGLFFISATRPSEILRLKHVSGIGIDVFYHHRETDDYWHGGLTMRWHNSPFTLEPRKFLGETFLVPADYDCYLTENYGDWRNPKVAFDSAYDTPNGECLSENELTVYTFKKLMNAMVQGNGTRARFYLQRLRELDEAAFADRFARCAGLCEV